jgi:hypothetical protein
MSKPLTTEPLVYTDSRSMKKKYAAYLCLEEITLDELSRLVSNSR